jgi:chromosome segregation ATPase
MSITDQIKDLEKQKEEIDHRIRQLQKVREAQEPSLVEAIEELQRSLKVIELQIEKDTAAIIQAQKNLDGVEREYEEVESRINQLQSLRYTKLFGVTYVEF